MPVENAIVPPPSVARIPSVRQGHTFQKKGDSMKKPNLIKEAHGEYERSIRFDERTKTLAEVGKAMTECYEFASKIMQRMAAFRPPAIQGNDIKLVGPLPAPKRKAVTPTQLHIDAAYEVLEQKLSRAMNR